MAKKDAKKARAARRGANLNTYKVSANAAPPPPPHRFGDFVNHSST